MGKYMRKCRGAAGEKAPAGELRAQVVVGVRTRSRSAATLAAVARATAPKRRKATTARVQEEGLARDDGAAGCYLHLRSRRLFMATAAVVEPRGAGAEEDPPAVPADSGAAGVAVVAGISRFSSTASSVDVAARERGVGDAEACDDRYVESSVSDSGPPREWRETTPSSQPPGDLSDLESSLAADEQKHHRRRCLATTTATSAAFQAAVGPRMPPAAEIEEFFAAAEKAEAERFAAKYNFDVVRGVPINAGRFEWTPVASG